MRARSVPQVARIMAAVGWLAAAQAAIAGGARVCDCSDMNLDDGGASSLAAALAGNTTVTALSLNRMCHVLRCSATHSVTRGFACVRGTRSQCHRRCRGGIARTRPHAELRGNSQLRRCASGGRFSTSALTWIGAQGT